MTPGTLDDTARRIAHAHWLEVRCFEILGAWVPTTAEPAVKLAFARQSHHHAWHAELFERVVPEANGFDAEGGGAPPPAWVALVDEVAALTATADRLAGAFGVLLPGKLSELEAWADASDPVRDAPLRRWLGFVVADERADLEEGRALLEAFPGADRAPARARLAEARRAAGVLLR